MAVNIPIPTAAASLPSMAATTKITGFRIDAFSFGFGSLLAILILCFYYFRSLNLARLREQRLRCLVLRNVPIFTSAMFPGLLFMKLRITNVPMTL